MLEGEEYLHDNCEYLIYPVNSSLITEEVMVFYECDVGGALNTMLRYVVSERSVSLGGFLNLSFL